MAVDMVGDGCRHGEWVMAADLAGRGGRGGGGGPFRVNGVGGDVTIAHGPMPVDHRQVRVDFGRAPGNLAVNGARVEHGAVVHEREHARRARRHARLPLRLPGVGVHARAAAPLVAAACVEMAPRVLLAARVEPRRSWFIKSIMNSKSNTNFFRIMIISFNVSRVYY